MKRSGRGLSELSVCRAAALLSRRDELIFSHGRCVRPRTAGRAIPAVRLSVAGRRVTPWGKAAVFMELGSVGGDCSAFG